ncbi:MAG: hypothetical protein AAFZ80_02995 [Cyanobacteria bacterium P01_A01_bin.105]
MTSIPTRGQSLDSQVLSPGQSPSFRWVWPMLWLSLLATSSAVGVWATVWMTRIPPLPNCQQASAFSTDGERLYCATAAAAGNTDAALIGAINLVSSWDQGHPLYDDSRSRLNDWTRRLLDKARTYVGKGDLTQARNLVEQIPITAEIHTEAQQEALAWASEWDRGIAAVEAIDGAIRVEDWPAARQSLQALKLLKSDYWLKTQHQALARRLKKEQTAYEQLTEARALAATGEIEKVAEAFALAREISLQTRAWPAAKGEIENWADDLLQYGFQKWEQEDLAAAIAIIQQVPLGMAKAPEAEDLIYFAHAQRLATANDDWVPTYGDLLNLVEAMAAVKQIDVSSPFYQQAQASLGTWQQKLDDVKQLYAASLLAQVGLKPTYELAVTQAQQIQPDRPQRQQAQTLLSHWGKEIERIEDQPVLSQADTLAAQGDIPALEAAIDVARQVELGRALRIEAQTRIATWLKRIEVIEDTPFMDKAQQLARDSKLREAVAEARKIEPGRALHGDAQASIRDWTAQIQIAEDRPILQAAEQLAAQGRLSDAIATATRIGRGRALSGQARSNIAIWSNQREAILSSRRRAADEASYDESDTAPDTD